MQLAWKAASIFFLVKKKKTTKKLYKETTFFLYSGLRPTSCKFSVYLPKYN